MVFIGNLPHRGLLYPITSTRQRTAKPVAIIGAGLAGLTAGQLLKRHKIPFILFESGPKLAGLAMSTYDEEGFSYDFGAHFITNRLAATVGIEDECETVSKYGEGVFLRGRFHSYPLGLLSQGRYLVGGLRARLRALINPQTAESAASWFRQHYGTALAEEVAIPLAKAWSGVPASELAPSVGEKLHGGILKTVWLRTAARLTGRPVACGYSREAPESARVWHVYPKGGLGRICEKLSEGLKPYIRLNSPVTHIQTENDRVKSVNCQGEDIPCSAVISTAPLNALGSLVRGTKKLEGVRQFAYRPMTFVNMRLKGRDLLPQPVVWTPGEGFPFFRVTEPPASVPWLAPEGKTVITADMGCQVNDVIWTMKDDALGELCLEYLTRLIPDARQRYLGCRVLRTPVAYPVYHRRYEAERQLQERATGIGGLYSIGRNGEFAHILMEDVHLRAARTTRAVIESLQVTGALEERGAKSAPREVCVPCLEAVAS
jgi:protoporphyrinogen oxidase